MKKFTSFGEVLKEMRTKNWFLFFCLMCRIRSGSRLDADGRLPREKTCCCCRCCIDRH